MYRYCIFVVVYLDEYRHVVLWWSFFESIYKNVALPPIFTAPFMHKKRKICDLYSVFRIHNVQDIYLLTVFILALIMKRLKDRIGGVIVSMLAWSVVDWGFKPRSDKPDYKIDSRCFFSKHAALMNKSKDGLTGNQYNVSMWSDMSTSGLLFQWTSTIKISNSACWFIKTE